MLGINGQKVYLLIMEAISAQQNLIVIKDDPKRIVSMDEFSFQLTLIEVVDKFIIPTNMEPEKIFNSISDAYLEPNGEGIKKFIDYRMALEKDQKNLFHGTLSILPLRQNLKNM